MNDQSNDENRQGEVYSADEELDEEYEDIVADRKTWWERFGKADGLYFCFLLLVSIGIIVGLSVAFLPRTQGSDPGRRVIIVSKSGDGQYTSISEAIRHARPNTHILIKPGLYTESLVVDKPLVISGDGPAGLIVVESKNSNCLQIKTPGSVTIRGLTLRGLAGSVGEEFCAVDIASGKVALESCNITSDSLTCVVVRGARAKVEMRKCSIYDGNDSGVWIYGKGEALLEDCDIYGNRKAGILISEGGYADIQKCRIHNMGANGVWIHSDSRGTLTDCDIYENGDGLAISENGSAIVRQCHINRNSHVGIRIYDRSGIADVGGCDLTGNTNGAWDIPVDSLMHKIINKE